MLQEERYKKKMGLGQEGNAVVILLAGLAVIFCLIQFLWVIYKMTSETGQLSAQYDIILHWFQLPSKFSVLSEQPWSVFTYFLIHTEVFKLLGNILWLWAFGYIMQDLAGNNKLIPVFLYSAIAGGIFYVIGSNAVTMPGISSDSNNYLSGSEAGVMGVAIATTMLSYNYRLFPMINGGIPLWVLTLVFVVIDMTVIKSGNPAIYIGHLAGGLMGLIFVLLLRQGHDWSSWMVRFADWVSSLFNPNRHHWKKTARDELYYNTGGTEPYKKIANITQKRIDDILDKINQQGYRFLTEEEKEILKRAAEDEEL